MRRMQKKCAAPLENSVSGDSISVSDAWTSDDGEHGIYMPPSTAAATAPHRQGGSPCPCSARVLNFAPSPHVTPNTPLTVGILSGKGSHHPKRGSGRRQGRGTRQHIRLVWSPAMHKDFEQAVGHCGGCRHWLSRWLGVCLQVLVKLWGSICTLAGPGQFLLLAPGACPPTAPTPICLRVWLPCLRLQAAPSLPPPRPSWTR